MLDAKELYAALDEEIMRVQTDPCIGRQQKVGMTNGLVIAKHIVQRVVDRAKTARVGEQ